MLIDVAMLLNVQIFFKDRLDAGLMVRLVAVILVVSFGMVGMAACGKKSTLDPVPGGTYPRSYPDPSS